MTTLALGLAPIRTQAACSVAVFGPRPLELVLTTMEVRCELEANMDQTSVRPAPTELPENPMRGAYWTTPDWYLKDGLPTVAECMAPITLAMEVADLTDVDASALDPTTFDLGEDNHFSPANAVATTTTQVVQRYPKDLLSNVYRTVSSVTSWSDNDALVSLSGPAPGPEKHSSIAYWRGKSASAPAIVWRGKSSLGSLGQNYALRASAAEWLGTNRHLTMLFAMIRRDIVIPTGSTIAATVSPLFEAHDTDELTKMGIHFDNNGKFKLYEYDPAAPASNPAYNIFLNVDDDLRRANQPIIFGLRLDNVTRDFTLIAADVRIHKVKGKLRHAVDVDCDLLIGDNYLSSTGPGAFDLLEMRWWKSQLSDAQLELKTAILADLWGVSA